MSTNGLRDEHLAYFTARAVPEDVVAARSVFTYQTKKQVRDLGFGDRTPAPGFAMPIHTVIGGLADGYQVHPNEPRTNAEGRTLKFEVPYRFKPRLDVHPWSLPNLADPTIPIWITEGVPKGDALVAAGQTAVALLGVWMFTGEALPDFEYLRLKGRTVFVAFDSDVMLKPSVHGALVRLGALLKLRGADVGYVYVPPGSQSRKQGIDDYLAAGGGIDALLAEHLSAEVRDVTPPPHDPQERATAQPPPVDPPDLARDLRILDRFMVDVGRAGVVGEQTTAAILYLVATSRLLDRLASAIVKGHSASGKSFTVETMMKFFPPAAYIAMTGMSQRAIVYSARDYRHRTLVLYEATALREGVEDDLTAYFIRTLLSEGRIEWEVTTKLPDGGFGTKIIVKQGPTNVIITTTKTQVHSENETRLLSLHTDDSPDQTRLVLAAVADENNDLPNFDPWHQLQNWLTTAEHRVTIPYAGALAGLIPPLAVRLRRDFGLLLTLVRAHAILHQLNRGRDDVGRVVASIDDYAVVRDLVGPLIAAGVEATVPAAVRDTVEAVARLTAPASDSGVTAVRVAAELKLDKSATSRRLHRASDGGWIKNLEDKKGRPGRWVIGDPLPNDDGVDLLPQPDKLENTPRPDETAGQGTGDPGGCTVAQPGATSSEGVTVPPGWGDVFPSGLTIEEDGDGNVIVTDPDWQAAP